MSIATRLSASITCLSVSILLAAQWLGLLPDKRVEILKERKAFCELLAIHCSLAAQRGDEAAIRSMVTTLKSRNAEIGYAAVRTADGRMLADTARFFRASTSNSEERLIKVPIALSNRLWGHVAVEFVPLTAGETGSLSNSEIRLMLFFASGGFLTYLCYAKFVLWRVAKRHTGLVPERVRATLDAFSEGILVLDNEDRIAFANRAFAALIRQSAAELQGKRASDFKWQAPGDRAMGTDLPWIRSYAEGVSQRNTLLELAVDEGQTSLVSVNATPIHDDDGTLVGAFATLDDQTPIQRKNSLLRRLLKRLKESRDTIRGQNRELEILATRDPLTNCLNRRAFVTELETHWGTACRYAHALSCVMVDIDRFKSINDCHGHAMGDEVLARVASVLNDNSRTSDYVCRYGGEEFCILLTHTEQAAARQFAEKLRQTIARLTFPQLNVTASFGISSHGTEVKTPQDLVDQADAALYLAKHSGRNRVMTWTDVTGATEPKRHERQAAALPASGDQ
ncbi:MAG: sensor domain-containing diguanylate cyclase [Planctomycetia bacterium]|nr:sensor domain-containing diguanylate cyclase [Planctomycetia bacterium]